MSRKKVENHCYTVLEQIILLAFAMRFLNAIDVVVNLMMNIEYSVLNEQNNWKSKDTCLVQAPIINYTSGYSAA